MKTHVGTKTTQPMPNGLMWPAVAISEETSEIKTVIDKVTNLPVDITVTRADFLSKRETKEGEPYLALTNEVVQYGRLSVAIPRFSNIVGFDVTEEGALISLDERMQAHAVSYGAFQKAGFEARATSTKVSDLG